MQKDYSQYYQQKLQLETELNEELEKVKELENRLALGPQTRAKGLPADGGGTDHGTPTTQGGSPRQPTSQGSTGSVVSRTWAEHDG